MAKQRFCIAAKTYPRPSTKYDELVCTAGVREDGSWIRLYPVPFRKLDYDKQYSKFHWVECDVEPRKSDFRPESHSLRDRDAIDIVGKIDTDKDGTWATRRDLLLRSVYTNLDALLADAYDKSKMTSIAVFKPTAMLKFVVEECEERSWKKSTLETIAARAKQADLFAGAENPFEVVEKIPYDFSYRFKDDCGRTSELKIIDWEIGQLFRRYAGQGEDVAIKKVQQKYWNDFALTKDIYLVLGTTLEFHSRKAPNPFLVISVFPPKHERQTRLAL